METAQPEKGGSINDQLAIERTSMANDRTLLSFIRTSLYFGVAGLTLTQVLSIRNGFALQVLFFALALLTLAAGLYKYRRQLRHIRQSRNRIDNYDFPESQANRYPNL